MRGQLKLKKKKDKKEMLNEIVGDEKDYEDITEKEYSEKAKKALKGVLKKKRLWVTVIMLVIFGGIIAYTLIDSNRIYKENILRANLMYQQELYSDVVMEDVRTLLSIYNNETYQSAKKSLALNEELYKKLFRDEEFSTEFEEIPPVVSILNIEYNLSEDDKCFLVTAKKQVGKSVAFYKVLVELYNDRIDHIYLVQV